MLVCLYPINVKTAEPIGPKFGVGPLMTPEKVYGCSKFQTSLPQILIFIKIKLKLKFNFIKIPRSFLYKIHELCIHTENVHNCNRRWTPNYLSQCTQGEGCPCLC